MTEQIDIANEEAARDELVKTEYLFDITRDFYDHSKPELRDRTERRLTEIGELGMEEVMTAEFGYKGVMSGLYIEYVWNYSDEEFKDYMDWARGLIERFKKGEDEADS